MSAARLYHRLHKLGAPPEVILAALEELEAERKTYDARVMAERAKHDQRLAKDRDRKAKKRAAERASKTVSVDTPRTTADTPPSPPTPPYKTPLSEDADASSGAGAPIYTDSRHELWGEGVTILLSLGVPPRQARSMIGSWLKQTGDDAQQVLGVIQRARDRRVIDPIPWITRALRNGSYGGNNATSWNGGFARNSVAFALRTADEDGAAADHDA